MDFLFIKCLKLLGKSQQHQVKTSIMEKHKIPLNEFPTLVTNDKLIEWGLCNPLKRHGYSPYQLINALYSDMFKPYQFRKIPQKYVISLPMLQQEEIQLKEDPQKVN